MADVILPLLFIIFIIALAGKRSVKKGTGKSKPSAGVTREMKNNKTDLSGKVHGSAHTHDRLDFDCYVNESNAEHYLKQLRSFLEAGIIDKNEYQQIASRWGEL